MASLRMRSSSASAAITAVTVGAVSCASVGAGICVSGRLSGSGAVGDT